ncbi:MAG: zinc ribbon domain-containing protein [Oscillospiraceae bacterium]|nr:zinc ribbon domain-containing protein [Oscillospiraceae bacterium]
MPFYDLICKACGKEANIRASVAEKAEKRVPCPSCGSYELETDFKNAPFSITKGSVGTECPNRHLCGEGCRH